jgi:hypothetical protein
VNKSLLTIFFMGIICMVVLTMFGSFFVGKVGGVENVLALRADLKQVFGSAMEDPEDLKIKVVMENDETGLLVTYAIKAATAEKKRAFEFHRRRLVNMIYGRAFWRRKAKFILLKIRLPNGRVHEETVRPPKKPA